MELSFLHAYFGILLFGLPALWLLWKKRGDNKHKLIRAAVLACVIVALTQPVLINSSNQAHHVIVVDQSDSLSADAQQNAQSLFNELAAKVSADDELTLVQLGGQKHSFEAEDHILISDASNTSSLSQALAHAIQTIPLGVNSSVTLITDGLATDQNWSKIIAQYQDRGIPVHTYDLGRDYSDLYIADIKAQAVRVGEKASVSVEVAGNAKSVAVNLFSHDSLLVKSPAFAVNGQTRIELNFEAENAGFHPLRAELEVISGEESDASNNQLSTVLAVQDGIKILYLGDRQIGAEQHLGRLLGAGFEIESVNATELTADFDFAQYDVVLQDDLPSNQISKAVQEKLVAAVQNQGVGLLHSGGESAFAGGGYFDTPIADALPVQLKQKDDKNDPSVGLAIIIDTSGSMAGSRIELAKQMARIAVRRLQPHDRIGIVEFYGAKHWAIPMQPASNKIEIDRAIGRMKAIGGTVLFPAIQEAYYGLKNINTRFKHIIMITDAGIEDDDYEGMLRRIAKDNINVSTILVGQGGHNLIMSDMANWGKGRFYSVGNEFNLVEMILKQPSTKKLPAYKRGAFSMTAQGGSGWWGDVKKDNLPQLAGYVQVGRKAAAEVLLEESVGKYPLLSSWQYGLGRVTALMTEPVGHGTQHFVNWEQYGQWLGRIIRKTASNQHDFHLTVKRKHDQLSIAAQRLSHDLELTPSVRILDWDGSSNSQPIQFDEKAPGLFVANLDFPMGQDALAEVKGNRNWQRSALRSYSDIAKENQVSPSKLLNFEKLSELTNGQFLNNIETNDWQLKTKQGDMAFIVTKLWPYLLLLALLLYIADLVYRRWPKSTRR
ncbi:VWA domain-containing protein [Parashewanella curva]|uniref:VWA domain-containing protein n=1 Tax=Parashewanella curva TaxID=2338552 RepID=A0A3L8PZD5_9GAMM|nr:VWA domain-containing protein [Parashewanella curva]RLV59888.1 VWA domain-containing protein [Parashewanella curva]